jgi:hypothetical protein
MTVNKEVSCSMRSREAEPGSAEELAEEDCLSLTFGHVGHQNKSHVIANVTFV